MSDAVLIVSAVRTPIGNLNGSLSCLAAHELGASLIRATSSIAKDVDEVILGQVLSGGQGMNPARQAAINAGLGVAVPAYNVAMVCGSGLKAVMLGADSIRAGNAKVVLAGGQESMSQAVHALHLRTASKFGHREMLDTMLYDGLTDAFDKCHMGITAENVAEKFNVTRADQDEFALKSQQKAALAQEHGFFDDEIVGIEIKNRRGQVEAVIKKDEFVKPDTSMDSLAKLRTVFKKENGTVTAGNASGLNDGAALVTLMSSSEAEKRGVKALARIVSSATVGIEPSIMGMGPVKAVQKAVEKANWSLDDVDLFELNEAFASQSVAVMRELGVDPDRVNVAGGAIALGHPIGASGCRVLVTLVHALRRLGKRRGCAALCVGGGMGVAMCVEVV